MLRLAHACGSGQPALVPLERVEIPDGRFDGSPAHDVSNYEPDWELPSPKGRAEIERLMLAG